MKKTCTEKQLDRICAAISIQYLSFHSVNVNVRKKVDLKATSVIVSQP